MMWTKGAHQSAKFQTFMKFHQIRTLIGSFCWKYITFQLKSSEVITSHDTEEWCKIWVKVICCFKNDKNLVNFDPSTQSLKNLYFDWFLLYKVYNIWPKKYRGVIFHDTEEWCKIWRKTDLWFGKWHEEFDRFSPEHLKVSELALWRDPFVQSRKCMG